MSEVKIVSEVYKISNSSDKVFNFLSDFRKFGMLFDAAKTMAGDKASEISDKIENIETTEDTCHFTVKGYGDAGVKIIDRDPNKTIKFVGDGRLPFDFIFWIQLIEKNPYETSLRLTLHADMNMMMKMMLKSKIEKGINQLAEGLTKIPYM